MKNQPHEAVIRFERMTVPCSYFGSLSQKQRILDVHTEISNRVLDLGVPEQYLDGAQVAGCLVDHGRFRSSQRVRAIVRCSKPNRCDPFIDQAGVLPRAHVP